MRPSMLYLLTILSLVQIAHSAQADEEILDLPGWSPRALPSKQYSGFVDANIEGSLKMHYWFVESEDSPETAPLLLWFNGGPGASSLYGLLVELGPFLVSDYSLEGREYEETGIPQLYYNPAGWQKVANILALSMPPPVGFSFCTPVGASATGNDCGSWNDTSTADVTHMAIKSWLERFPEYKKNEMYIAGESYAGVYVPMIVRNILAHPEDNINLKGFAVGDACTPPDICGSKPSGPYFQIQFLFGKNAISNRLYEEINFVCSQEELMNGGLSPTCAASVNQIDGEAGGYWAYAYYDDCWYENDIRRSRKLISATASKAAAGGISAGSVNERPYYGPPIAASTSRKATTARGSGDSSRGIDSLHDSGSSTSRQKNSVHSIDVELGGELSYPTRVVDVPNGYACGGPIAQVEYLSHPAVKKAIHVPPEANFFQCDNGGDFTYELTEHDLVSWYKEVVASNKLRVLVYNGDTDPCINAYQAQEWTRNLGFAETQAWRPWTVDGCQRMGGYVTRYENGFDYLTIRGSGHMVPQFKPTASLEFITQFLIGGEYKHYDATCSGPAVANLAAAATATGSSHPQHTENEPGLALRSRTAPKTTTEIGSDAAAQSSGAVTAQTSAAEQTSAPEPNSIVQLEAEVRAMEAALALKKSQLKAAMRG